MAVTQVKDRSTDHQLVVNADGSINVNTSGTAVITGTVDANLNGLASFQTSQYTIGVAAVQLTVTPLANRSSISIKASTTSTFDIIYIGNSSSVSTSDGYALFNGDTLQMDLTPAQEIWAISNAASQTLFVLELG